ncbi:glycosyltransferase family 4 protein [Elizabethkingia anophelis]|nr:glycosyltransferase family 4 protein [Elizabethkingia anophelis]
MDKVIVLTQHDLKDWSTSHSNVAQIYNFCSFSSDKIPDYKIKRAIAIGRLDAQKGFDMLIDSWVINKDKLVEWRLDIYGQGEWEDMLKQKIIDNKLEQNITLKGVTNDIKTELQNSSLFLFSSRYEGFGLAIIEAMTVGLPVISFDCPQGPSEMVNTDNGFLIELGDLNGFSNAIVKVTSDNELRKKNG